MATALAPIKVDATTDQLVTQAAHFLGRSKKDVVDVAVREYVENHRAEIQQGVTEALARLDGSVAAAVGLLADATPEEIADLGGIATD
jgi:hypothetical protein